MFMHVDQMHKQSSQSFCKGSCCGGHMVRTVETASIASGQLPSSMLLLSMDSKTGLAQARVALCTAQTRPSTSMVASVKSCRLKEA